MKKLLILTNFVSLAVVGYLLVKLNKADYALPIGPDLPAAIAPDCYLGKTYENVDVPGMIQDSIAKILFENYGRDLGKKYVIQDNVITKIEDARCLRFDFEKLKSYLWKIEKQFCGKNCQNLRLGMRFYYGKYGDTASVKKLGIDSNYAFKHTLFMVPTYYDAEKKMHIDFDPFNIGDPCKPTPLKVLLNSPRSISNKKLLFLTIDPQGGEVDNHGGLMPPPAGTGNYPSEY